MVSGPEPAIATRETFSRAVAYLIDVLEGGPQVVVDTGGTTRWGISQNAYPDEDIANLSRDRAEFLYRRDYWNAVDAARLPAPLALLVFDAAVNQGPGNAARFLQECLGSVRVDGAIGPRTVGAVRAHQYPHWLRLTYSERRLGHYEELAWTKPGKYRSSLKGWRIRVLRVHSEADRWAAAENGVPLAPEGLRA